MTFATNLQAAASRLLTAYGQSISVLKDVVASYTVATGAVVQGTDVTYTGYGHPQSYTKENIDGVLIQSGDIKLLFYSATQPSLNDIFTLDSLKYTAVQVSNKKVQGSNIYYEVQLRK